MPRNRAQIDVQTARMVAAYIKAFGVSPRGSQLASILGIQERTAMRRMQRAARRGWLHRRYRGYWPVYDRLPLYLREPRPVVS
jgi:hypothetical protein